MFLYRNLGPSYNAYELAGRSPLKERGHVHFHRRNLKDMPSNAIAQLLAPRSLPDISTHPPRKKLNKKNPRKSLSQVNDAPIKAPRIRHLFLPIRMVAHPSAHPTGAAALVDELRVARTEGEFEFVEDRAVEGGEICVRRRGCGGVLGGGWGCGLWRLGAGGVRIGRGCRV